MCRSSGDRLRGGDRQELHEQIRRYSLEAQAAVPIEAADEMAGAWPVIIALLAADADFKTRHDLAFPKASGISPATVAAALADSITADDLRKRLDIGVWEIFIPGASEGQCYKFELLDRDGRLLPQKADPYARQSELRPATASVVTPTPRDTGTKPSSSQTAANPAPGGSIASASPVTDLVHTSTRAAPSSVAVRLGIAGSPPSFTSNSAVSAEILRAA